MISTLLLQLQRSCRNGSIDGRSKFCRKVTDFYKFGSWIFESGVILSEGKLPTRTPERMTSLTKTMTLTFQRRQRHRFIMSVVQIWPFFVSVAAPFFLLQTTDFSLCRVGPAWTFPLSNWCYIGRILRGRQASDM
jgi:hypothetical protein